MAAKTQVSSREAIDRTTETDFTAMLAIKWTKSWVVKQSQTCSTVVCRPCRLFTTLLQSSPQAVAWAHNTWLSVMYQQSCSRGFSHNMSNRDRRSRSRRDGTAVCALICSKHRKEKNTCERMHWDARAARIVFEDVSLSARMKSDRSYRLVLCSLHTSRG